MILSLMVITAEGVVDQSTPVVKAAVNVDDVETEAAIRIAVVSAAERALDPEMFAA